MLTREMQYWLSIHRPKESKHKDRLEVAVRRHLVSRLAENGPSAIAKIVADIADDALKYNLPQNKSAALEKYSRGKQYLLDVAEVLQVLRDHPLGAAFLDSAPFSIDPMPVKTKGRLVVPKKKKSVREKKPFGPPSILTRR